MAVLVIVNSLFLLCIIVAVSCARATRANTPSGAAAATQQRVEHDEGLAADDEVQAQLRASISTTSGSRILSKKLAAAQARRHGTPGVIV